MPAATTRSADSTDPAPPRSQNPSIRLLVSLCTLVPLLVIASVLTILLVLTSWKISEDLCRSVMSAASQRAASEIRWYLSSAVRTAGLYERRVRDGRLPPDHPDAWRDSVLDDLLSDDNVAAITFSDPQARSIYIQRGKGGRIELGIASGPGEGQTVEVEIDPATRAVKPPPLRIYAYDAPNRPWYRAAVSADAPGWTPVYFWFGDQGADSEIGTGYTTALRREDESLIGVIVVDVTLGAISQFLRHSEIARRGHVFVIDEDGLLIGASEGAVSSPEGQRIGMRQSPSAAARSVAETGAALVGRMDGMAAGVGDARVRLDDGAPAQLSVRLIEPYRGIRWRIVTVLPESAFLDEARSAQRRAGWAAAIGIVSVGLIALRLATYLSRPVVRLREHARRIGQGQFDQKLALHSSARELSDLADDLNRMSDDLQRHVELRHALELATQIQQSLLPRSSPNLPGLDVAGVSKYCDMTGGDYYDFVEIAAVDQKRLVVAVGDVMGHGIAAALLMATARAALRSSAGGPLSLGELMNRVNAVLCRDTDEVQFMTLLLVIADPSEGVIRWSSAGHDPAILFDARSRAIRELDGADVPLGVTPDVTFNDFSVSGVSPGSVLLIGTDGVWEALNPAGEMFGKQRLYDLMQEHADRPAAQISAEIDLALHKFMETARPQDDVTYVVVKLIESR